MAIVANTIVLILTWFLQPLLTPTLFALFYASITLTSLYGGKKAGILATVLAGITFKFFFIPPIYSLAIDSGRELFRLIILLSVALLLVFVSAGLRNAKLRVERNLQKLQETQQLFESFMKHSPTTAYIKDETGRYIYVNQTVERIFARQLKDFIGKTDFDFLPSEVAQQWRSNDLAVLASNQGIEFIETALQPDGEHIYTAFKFSLPNAQGRKLLAGISLDITESQRIKEALHESNERYRILAEGLPQFVWISAPDSQLEYCNQCWYEYTGLNREQTLNSGWAKVVYPDDVERLIQRWNVAATTKESYEIEYRVRKTNGEYRWFLGSIAPIHDSRGNVIKWVGSAIDIHDRKQAEAEHTQLLAAEQTARQEAEQARTQAEVERSRLHEFFRKAPALIAVTKGRDHIYEFVNTAHQEVVGRSEAELIGKPMKEIFPELQGQGFFEALDEVHQTGITFEGNEMPAVYDRYHDGTIYQGFFNCVYQPLWNAAGEIEGILLHGVEVTEQVLARQRTEELLKQLESERGLLEAVLQQMPGGVIIAEAPSGKLILGNKQVEQIWRKQFVPSDNVEQYDRYPGFHPDGKLYQAEEWPLARSLTTGEIVTGEEIKILRGDGSYGFIEVSSAPICDRTGKIVAGVVTFHDITDRKQAEKEREQILAREQAAREEAEAANRTKDEFLAVLSHELRSPLNPILGWAKLLRTRQFNQTKTAQALETIERNAKLQAQLVEDLLDVSRILSGKLSLNIAPVNLINVIEAAIETVRLAATAKSIQIDTNFSPNVGLVTGDANRLQQVIWNLLSNAVKFTQIGGKVEVKLEEVNQQAQIQVIDNGKGINPEFLPFVFDYFRQADSSTTRKFGGLGLGLAIVRQVIELHGGTVLAASKGEGKGATFTVKLPLLNRVNKIIKSEKLNDLVINIDALPLAGVKILLVDDEADVRQLMSFVLEEYGATMTVVSSAKEALTAFNESVPDILVSDIGMPEMDGYMLLEKLRFLPTEKGGEVPAIALTAYAGEINEQKALSSGFQKHIAKPVEPETLMQAISSLVKPTNIAKA
ncbi:PAS domain-containing protein [Phormidium sp. LEGE 05292]|uniref:hybrid sensor histidine kinase/response regulator n=1 Tax=[Phormidium] sp. LEGE 05292 TaxID=767427 RepID=UPI001882A5A2|nr:PAS domain-containing protein [Phormidium sp. LEGE 05292]MBE9225910.1 PAS domain-containing protein [Phormidium sp. LEGE 05292]